ncbi:MAG: hypothetical protein HZB25_09615 [Candidatus Eisenbacteria bacterium]|nr:hypothetical protein [Candidatus Eisenbacteria bacterium]
MNGRGVCTAAGIQNTPVIASDGAGGAIIAWGDQRGGTSSDIYAQHVLASGSTDGAWPTNGRPVCTATGSQWYPVVCADGAGGSVVAWADSRAGLNDIYAQRVERFGQLGDPEPMISRIRDVLNDQGGRVAVEWTASYLDVSPSFELQQYSIWRRVPTRAAALLLAGGAHLAGATRAASGANDRWIRTSIHGSQTLYWEYVATQPARGFPGYSYVAATTGDSMSGSYPYTSFMVLAEKTGGIPFWASSPESGFSVDNLPPAKPSPFTGNYSGSSTALHWGKNTEADLAFYRLHRGGTQGFVPGPGNLVSQQPDTGYVDYLAGGAWDSRSTTRPGGWCGSL